MAARSASLVHNNLRITVLRRPAIMSFIEPPEDISKEAKKFCSRHGLMPSEQRFIHDIFVLNLLASLMGVESHLSMKNRAGCRQHKERSILDELAAYGAYKSQKKRWGV